MNTNERFLVTINRELGSGGRTVGEKLAERLGVTFYDKILIKQLVKEFDLDVDKIEQLKGRKQGWWAELCNKLSPAPGYDYYRMAENGRPELVTTDDLFKAESRILGAIAEDESCVVAGRAGFHVLRNHPNKIRVFIRASMAWRIERVMRRQGLGEEEAAAVIEKVDAARENYVKHYTGTSRYDARNYDLVLNMDGLSDDDAVEVILDYIRRSE